MHTKNVFDKNNFIQNLLLDNLLLVDIYNRAKKLHIEVEARRVVYMIETKQEKDLNARELFEKHCLPPAPGILLQQWMSGASF